MPLPVPVDPVAATTTFSHVALVHAMAVGVTLRCVASLLTASTGAAPHAGFGNWLGRIIQVAAKPSAWVRPALHTAAAALLAGVMVLALAPLLQSLTGAPSLSLALPAQLRLSDPAWQIGADLASTVLDAALLAAVVFVLSRPLGDLAVVGLRRLGLPVGAAPAQ